MDNILRKTPYESHLNKRDYSIKFYTKSFFIAALILVMIIIEIINKRSYHDEVIGLVSAFYLLFMRSKFERRDIITLVTLAVVVIIGLLSNLVGGLVSSVFSILIDVVAETKLLFAYFALKYFLTEKEKQAVIDMLLPMSKLFAIASFLCGIISIFTDIGMSGEARYGLPGFTFVFRHAHQFTAVYMLIFGIFVCTTKLSETKKSFYYTISIINLILITKAPPIIFSIIFVGLCIYFKRNKRISIWVIALGCIIIYFVSEYQIETYLLDETSPRHLLIEYSAKTANTYFPLGSGFSTYGSDQAARNYSPLYYQYGFDHYWKMTPDDYAFLDDNFWPMAIGQFGWIGGLLYLTVFVRLFFSLQNENFSNQRRAFLYAVYIQYMIHAVGSAILSSSAGMIGFAAIALFTAKRDETRRKGRIRIQL